MWSSVRLKVEIYRYSHVYGILAHVELLRSNAAGDNPHPNTNSSQSRRDTTKLNFNLSLVLDWSSEQLNQSQDE
jgi:hypothetical protein